MFCCTNLALEPYAKLLPRLGPTGCLPCQRQARGIIHKRPRRSIIAPGAAQQLHAVGPKY